MTDKLTIVLRGQTYTADSPTKHEAIILCGLFLPGDTEVDRIAAIEKAAKIGNLIGIDLNNPEQLTKLAATIMVRLQNPATAARVARVVKSIFPAIPDALVSHRLIQASENQFEHDYRWKLEDDELLNQIIVPLLNWITANQVRATANTVKGFTPVDNRERKGFTPVNRKRKHKTAIGQK